VTSSANRPRAAIEAAATKSSIATIRSTATMQASAAAMKTAAMKAAPASAVKTASAAAVKTASTSTVKTTAAAVTAASVLSECWIWKERKTDDCRKCDERCAKTECAHNLYLPSNLGARLRATSLCEEPM
jgi:hypothetical protein